MANVTENDGHLATCIPNTHLKNQHQIGKMLKNIVKEDVQKVT